ncbi:hypothetical protein L7F22_032719 [Adiantum nelumboides]|nr:hypothetical protein [Adiantum nelumboides]
MRDFEAIQIQHISRQHNKETDNMANTQFEVMVEAIKFKEPLFQGQETMEDILYFLETGECPKHLERVQRHRLVRKSLSYQLIGQHLYHKGKDLVLRRVPLVKEIEKILMSCHDGVCCGHFAQEITSKKILQSGFVWPSLHRDVQHWCKACKACQQAGDRKLSYGPRFPIFAYGPFEKWGIDAIGSLARTSIGKQYILTATDYMTRWAKAASVARITAADVSKFVLDYICSRFGTPLEILSDRGPGFRVDLLDALLETLSIKQVHSTPYYPQCNGLVEKTNGILCKIITKHVRDRPQDWDKHLTAALWAYRTSFKVSTQFTPYHLVYGQEALLPIEVELGSLRVLARETTSSKEKLEQRILDLQRLELDREAATDYYITQANKKREQFNNKVKEKKLDEGMLVMRLALLLLGLVRVGGGFWICALFEVMDHNTFAWKRSMFLAKSNSYLEHQFTISEEAMFFDSLRKHLHKLKKVTNVVMRFEFDQLEGSRAYYMGRNCGKLHSVHLWYLDKVTLTPPPPSFVKSPDMYGLSDAKRKKLEWETPFGDKSKAISKVDEMLKEKIALQVELARINADMQNWIADVAGTT